MICEYCQSEWFPAKFHPGCCGECGAPRLRSAPQAGRMDQAGEMFEVSRPVRTVTCYASAFGTLEIRPDATAPDREWPVTLADLENLCEDRWRAGTSLGELVLSPRDYRHLAQVVLPMVGMRQVLSETFPYQTFNAMNNALMAWRIGR